ncbi:MAG: transposase [Gammaproteobacteria bacterium]|nr:transposase [Gammaproteobacteria bacterium]
MSHLPRITPANIPVHLNQRGNNRQICFGGDEDMQTYIHRLKTYSTKYAVAIQAWVLMSNHVHLLYTPAEDGAVGRHYVHYFKYQYQRSDTLWESHSKSSLIDARTDLLLVYRVKSSACWCG